MRRKGPDQRLDWWAEMACCREGSVTGTARPIVDDSVAFKTYPVMPAQKTRHVSITHSQGLCGLDPHNF